MDEQKMWEIAHKRAGYALGIIANHQMNTWAKYPTLDDPKQIIAAQIVEAMNDALTNERNL